MSARSKTTPNTAQNFNNQRIYQTRSNLMNTFPMYVPATASMYQPTTASMYQPTTASMYQPTTASMYQPTTASMYQPTTASMYQPTTASMYQPTAASMYNITNTGRNVFTPMTAAQCDSPYGPRGGYPHHARTDYKYTPQTNLSLADIPGVSYLVSQQGPDSLTAFARDIGTGAIMGAGTGATIAAAYDAGKYFVNR